MEKKNYSWKPIELWQGPWVSDGLETVFQEFQKFAGEETYLEFRQQAVREWSISTGEIEGAYEIGRGVTEAMIANGLVQNLIPKQRNGLSEASVLQILVDHKDVLEGLFEFIKTSRSLSVSDVRQFHQALMASVEEYEVYFVDPNSHQRVKAKIPLERGQFKSTPNNPSREDGSSHEYCPPLEVDEEMRRLVALFAELESKSFPATVKAGWLHHAFSQIHPFQDGNGRVARVLASFVLIKSGLPPFTVIPEMKTRYILALESADQGDPKPFLDFVQSILFRQGVRLLHALQAGKPKPLGESAGLDEIISAANASLMAKHKLFPREWGHAVALLDDLRSRARGRLEQYAGQISRSLGLLNSQFGVSTRSAMLEAEKMSVATAEMWGEGFSKASISAEFLTIQTGPQFSVVVGFDRFSENRPGLCGAFVATQSKEGFKAVGNSFFFHYGSRDRSTTFDAWVERNLKLALVKWQESLG